MNSIDIKTVAISTILGAVAGGVVAWMNSSSIAVANVQEIVATSSKIQALQEEQKAKIEGLASFVNSANNEINKEKSDSIKEQLKQKYSEELAAQKAEFEAEYVKKLSEISDELSNSISEKAKDEGYDLVLSKDAVVSGADDITKELVEMVK